MILGNHPQRLIYISSSRILSFRHRPESILPICFATILAEAGENVEVFQII